MNSVPPVVDYKRMERLRPPENTVLSIPKASLCRNKLVLSLLWRLEDFVLHDNVVWGKIANQ